VGAITRALPPEKEFEKHPPKKISSLKYFFQKPLDKVAKIYYNRIMVSIKSLLTKTTSNHEHFRQNSPNPLTIP
jgi:hypothetical protein